jgi:polysaccharide biosynthesis/export protein
MVGASMRILLAFLLFCGFLTSASAQHEALRPGDNLTISVWQDPKLDRQIVVGPDGMISFPLAGHIKAGGMTTTQLEEALKSRLQKNYTSPLDITVAMAGVNEDTEGDTRPKFYVTGEVGKAGSYLLRPLTNVVDAIAVAGGLGPFAAKRRIQVHRQVKGVDTVFTFDYYAFLAGTIGADNIQLRSGDIVVVPERGLLE